MKIMARQNLLRSWHRRKIVHVCTGPIFLLTWPLFSLSEQGRIAAALVPLSITAKFILVGLGVLRDEDTVQSMSRSGRRQELLYGPLLYGVVFVLATYFYWRSMRAIICLLVLCVGDGFAEIVGKAWRQTNKLPWSPKKSYAGWIGFTLCSAVSIVAFLAVFGDYLFRIDDEMSFSVEERDAAVNQFLHDAQLVRSHSVSSLIPRVFIDC